MTSRFHRLFSGSVLQVVSLGSSAIVAFLLMPIVVRALGDRMYGLWALVGAMVGYYGLLDFGLSNAVSKHIAGAIGRSDDTEGNRIFSTALALYTALGCIALLVTLALAGLASLFVEDPADRAIFVKIILLLGFDIAIGFPIRAYSGTLIAHLRFDIVSGTQLLTLALRTILVVWAMFNDYKILALAWSTVLAGIPGKILLIYAAKSVLPALRFDSALHDPKTRKALLSYGMYGLAVGVFDRLRFHADFFVISAYIGLSAVTHYKIAAVFFEYFIGLITSAMGVLQPLFSQMEAAHDYLSIEKVFFFSTKISICISSFLGAGIIVWGHPFIRRWMGPDYLDAYPALLILIFAATFELWQAPSIALIYGTGRHRFYAWSNALEGVLNLGLSLVLVRYYGIMGVAIGTFIPMCFTKLVIQPLWVCRAYQFSYLAYLRQALSTIISCYALIAGAFICCTWGLKPAYFHLFSSSIVAGIVYSVACWFLVFDSQERNHLSSVLLSTARQWRTGPPHENTTG